MEDINGVSENDSVNFNTRISICNFSEKMVKTIAIHLKGIERFYLCSNFCNLESFDNISISTISHACVCRDH